MKPDPARLDPAIYPFTIEITTRFGDMDVNHHLNNVAYARYLEEGRVSFNHGLFLENGRRVPELADWRSMIAHVAISYLAEGRYGPPVTVGVGVLSLGNRSFTMAAAVFQGDVCLATHEAVIVFQGPGPAMPGFVRDRLSERMVKLPH